MEPAETDDELPWAQLLHFLEEKALLAWTLHEAIGIGAGFSEFCYLQSCDFCSLPIIDSSNLASVTVS
jgi:hypothetical protein